MLKDQIEIYIYIYIYIYILKKSNVEGSYLIMNKEIKWECNNSIESKIENKNKIKAWFIANKILKEKIKENIYNPKNYQKN
jgi:hypothetical protein